MGNQMIIPGSEGAALVSRELAFLRAAEAATRRVLEPHSERTKSAYRIAWERWGRHCAEFSVRPLPIDPKDLIDHLEWMRTNGAAPNTVRLALAALSSLDQASRITAGDQRPLSVRTHPTVKRWLQGWSADPANPRAPRKQAPALHPSELEHLLRIAAEPVARGSNRSPAQHVAKYIRDRAMILLGVCAALRVSELVALDHGDVQRVERGLRVLVRRSKVDQHGEGALIGVSPQAHLIRCPVDAMAQWWKLRGDHDGPLFVGVERSGALSRERLCGRQAQTVISQRARAAGLELVTSHSMRATFATLASERGKPLHKIAEQGRWRSLNVLRGYVRQGELFDQNPSAGLLDG